MSSGLAPVLVAALAFVPTAATSPAASPDGVLGVSTASFGGTSVTLVQVASADAVARVTLTAPTGYTAALGAPPGARLGFVIVGLSDVPGTTSASASAELVVEDPAQYVGRPEAESCAPGRHQAVWKAALSVLGQAFDLVLYVDALASGGASVTYCPIWPSSTLPAGVTAHQVAMFVEQVFTQPSAPGRHTWTALVSPPGTGLGADPGRTFELRAVEPVPHTLTLRARYDAKRRTVVLSGKLTAVGQPEPGAEVLLTASTSSFDELSIFGPVTTNASGEFSVTRRVEVTTQFSAGASLEDGPCATPSVAPAGCVRESVTSPPDASAIVRVRTAADPKLVVRSRDQALARRANLVLADFPGDWEAIETFSFFACKGFRPRLADLTASGDVESRTFFSEEAAAASRATVYTTEALARKAFGRSARVGLARCVADEARAAGADVLQLGPTRFPSLGTETRAFRVVYALGEVVVNTDFVWFRQGRTVVQLGFSSATQPLVYADVVALKVAARLRRG